MVEGIITEEEAALYDRQIRLWGIEAQKRLRTANALIIGLNGLAAEITKNVVLAGINSITLLDNCSVTEDDFASQFLLDRCGIGQNRAEASAARTQKLNPLVKVVVDKDGVDQKADDFFKAFSVVCVSDCTWSQLLRINAICHVSGIQFYCCDVYGYYGYMFADLGRHSYTEEEQRPKVPAPSSRAESAEATTSRKRKLDSVRDEMETVTLRKEVSFVDLQAATDSSWWKAAKQRGRKRTSHCYFAVRTIQKFIESHKRRPSPLTMAEDVQELKLMRRDLMSELELTDDQFPESFVTMCSSQLSPVCAVVGGIVGQEIIKAVSHKDAPHNNFFLYDPMEGSGYVERMGATTI